MRQVRHCPSPMFLGVFLVALHGSRAALVAQHLPLQPTGEPQYTKVVFDVVPECRSSIDSPMLITVARTACVASPIRRASANVRVAFQDVERHSRWVTGLGVGFLSGAVLGAVIGLIAHEEGDDIAPAQVAALFGGVGAVSGAVIGAVVGATIHVERSPSTVAVRFTATIPHNGRQ